MSSDGVPSEAAILEAIRGVGPSTFVKTPPGRLAVSRDHLLLVLGVHPQDSDPIDAALEQHGGELRAIEFETRDGSRRRRPPAVFYVVPEALCEVGYIP